MVVTGAFILFLKNRGKIKNVRTVPALFLTLCLIMLISNISSILVLRGDDSTDIAPPTYVFVGVIITVIPVVCEYVYNRTLATTLLVLVVTMIVQFAVSDVVSVGVGILSLAILIII